MGEHPSIALIGGGVMGEAILAGVLRHKLTDAQHIFISDPIVDRGTELSERYGVTTSTDSQES